MDSIYSVYVENSKHSNASFFVTFVLLFKWLPAMADTFRVSFDESITVDSSTYAVLIVYESHVLYYFTATNLHAGLNCLILLLHCAFFYSTFHIAVSFGIKVYW